MKNIRLILVSLIAFFSVLTLKAQDQTQNPFSGLKFRIDNYIGDKFDNAEDLTFTKDYVEGSICVQYGFEKASYKAEKNESGNWQFTCEMISKEHGKMVWEGTKKDNTISGSYKWTKAGQEPIDYTFKGKTKQNEK